MMSTATNTVFINRALEDVFDFATTPKHWPQYHPNSLGVTGVTERSVLVGDVTRERANLMGRIGEGDWKVIERDAPHNPVASSRAPQGGASGARARDMGKVVWTIDNPGFKAQLTYAFAAKDGGTQFTRTLAYTVPFTGEQLAQFEQFMHDESEKAVQNLKKVMENK
jgi:polyketide cyclase/dehydrase/lipid transport protein